MRLSHCVLPKPLIPARALLAQSTYSRKLQAGFSIFAVLFALTVVEVRAQVTSVVLGVVSDATGARIPAASVTVTNAETGMMRTAETDDRGVYRILSLPAGAYEVKAEKVGFRTGIRNGIQLVVTEVAVVNVELQVGEAAQQIIVSADAALISTATNSVAGLVGEQQVKQLPLNGRSWDNLITLNPGTANTTSNRSSTSTGAGQGNNFSIAGNREDFNLFLMNGIEYTGVSTADVIPGGLSGQLLGVDAVREFNVLENSYGAEYGKRPGGQISVITMSGSNQVHGTLFEFLRNNVFDARNFFDHTIGPPPFRRNQFGGSAGGPVQKDKTFIFGSYEGFRQRLALSSVAVVPDNNARNGLLPTGPGGALVNVGLAKGIAPYFALWPVADGSSLGGGAALYYGNPGQAIREDFGNLRVDRVISARDSVSGVYTVDDGYNLTPGSNPLQQTLSTLRSQIVSVQETHVFSPNWLNTFRVGYSRAAWNTSSASAVNDPSLSFVQGLPIGSINIGASTGNGVSGSFASAGSNGSQQVDVIARNLFTYSDDVSLIKGKHQITLGGWFQRVQSNENAADQRNGIATFADIQHFIQGQATQVVATLNPIEIPWRQFAGAWYVQDSIQLRPNLTLTLGVRHEFNNGWNSPTGTAGNFVFGPNGVLLSQPVVGKSIYTQNNAKFLFGPRAGLAWAPFGGSKTAVRAGYGIYYEQLDYMGACCDAIALGNYNYKVTVAPTVFPVLLSPSEPLPGSKLSPLGVQSNLKTPAVAQYTLKIEEALSANTLLSVGYVGAHGYHLLATADVNTAFPTIVNGQQFFPPKSPKANPNLGNSRYELSDGDSNYNALQADLTHRFSEGLQFRANYTYSKSLDNHSSSFLGNEGVGGTTTFLDPRNPRADWGPSNFNIPNRFAGSVSYELPFGHDKPFLSSAAGLTNAILGGWQINTIVSMQSGFPFTPLVGFNQSGNGDTRNPDRPSVNPGFSGPVIVGSPTQWYNPNAYILPLAGTFGNVGRDILSGPGLVGIDASAFKNFRVRERMNLQFRAEIFNVINHPNFGLPNITTFTASGGFSPSAGLITNTATASRQIQFGLKLTW